MKRLKELLSDNASLADDLESYAFQIEGFVDPEDEERSVEQLRSKHAHPGPRLRIKERDDMAREPGRKALAKKRGKP